MKSNNPRVIASKILRSVIYKGESLSQLLVNSEDASDPLVRDLCFGSLRWHERISALLNELLAKPLKNKDKDVECLLRVGFYQIIYQQTPDHAAVNETVSAVKGLKKPWAKKFVNGVLRGFLRKKDALLQQVDEQDTARYAFPAWLLGKIKKSWPDDWQSILEASNTRAPMVLRVNLLQQSRKVYHQQLLAAGFNATLSDVCDTAIVLDSPINVYELPNFSQGAVSVQDTAAQLAAGLLDLKSGMHVLDACAAPGGKTGHILENCQGLTVVAVDNSASRLVRVEENLERLSLQATLLTADAGDVDSWAKDLMFDRILLDAPCSATGVIRRHPDIKCLRRPDDIAGLQQQQKSLLTKLWSKLKPNGKLLYATCSILPQENEKQIADFVEQREDVEVQEIEATWGRAVQYGRQILSGESAMDGFYYALLVKNP
ncbi:MAG TPA: 16S rRNA (cytosine(967)-C(5))-methyltransferase RsmB [Leucothrix mucor]|nr:16S rRNA (cytosine(967)-C(5))-methyltransferase RsmB [Leucothrix mucor]